MFEIDRNFVILFKNIEISVSNALNVVDRMLSLIKKYENDPN